MDVATKKAVTRRLQRVAGQVDGLVRMVDGERYCVDILLQIAATLGALGQVGRIVLKKHVQTCVTEALSSGDEGERQQKIDELMDVFSRYANLKEH